ncbi:penicillin-binding protein 2, partial [candidate division FCPU426 bacterium]|nr:penicillin-binding protein 2 [candidate division FCPU426 bacterium]
MLWDHFVTRKEEKFQKRIQFIGGAIIILFALIIFRLAYLQLFQGQRYVELSARNRVRLVPIKAQRGLIFDRQGEMLVGNVSSFSVSVIPADLPKDPG